MFYVLREEMQASGSTFALPPGRLRWKISCRTASSGGSIKNLANDPEATINTGYLQKRFPWEMPQGKLRLPFCGVQVSERRASLPGRPTLFNQEMRP